MTNIAKVRSKNRKRRVRWDTGLWLMWKRKWRIPLWCTFNCIRINRLRLYKQSPCGEYKLDSGTWHELPSARFRAAIRRLTTTHGHLMLICCWAPLIPTPHNSLWNINYVECKQMIGKQGKRSRMIRKYRCYFRASAK